MALYKKIKNSNENRLEYKAYLKLFIKGFVAVFIVLSCLLSGMALADDNMIYDINSDGLINHDDFTEISKCLGTVPEDPGYNAACDINNDEKIDSADIKLIYIQLVPEIADEEDNTDTRNPGNGKINTINMNIINTNSLFETVNQISSTDIQDANDVANDTKFNENYNNLINDTPSDLQNNIQTYKSLLDSLIELSPEIENVTKQAFEIEDVNDIRTIVESILDLLVRLSEIFR